MRLFHNQKVDAVTTSVKVINGSQGANLYVSGDLGGGILTTEVLVPDGITWIRTDMDEYIDQPGLYVIDSSSVILRIRLSGSNGKANLTVWLLPDGVSNKQFVSRGYGDI